MGLQKKVNWSLIDLEMSAEGLKTQRYLVKSILGYDEFAAIYGPSGCGKSFLAIHLAGAIARGVSWFGHKTTASGVAYVVAEGAGGFAKRWVGYKLQNELEYCDNLIAPNACPRLGGASSEVEELIAFLEEESGTLTEPLRLVIIDTLAQTLAGQDENTSAAMTALIQDAKLIQQRLGVTVLFVHHTGKDWGRGLRGHSSLKAALDTVISVQDNGHRAQQIWSLEKRKDGEGGICSAFELTPVTITTDVEGDSVTTCIITELDSPATQQSGSRRDGVSKYDPVFQTVIDQLKNEGRSQVELQSLAELFGKVAASYGNELSHEALRKALKGRLDQAVAVGQVSREGDWITLWSS